MSVVDGEKVRFRIHNIFKFMKTNGLIAFFTIIVISGMILGGILVNLVNINTIKKLDVLFSSDFDNRIAQPLWYTFVSSLSSSFLFWIIMIAVSAALLGPILVPIILIFKSIGLGLTAGYLYLIYSLKGVAFYILVLLPGFFISSIGFIFMAVYSAKFSVKVSSKFLPNSQEERLWPDLVKYLRESGSVLIILVFASIVDMVFMSIFSKLFSF